MPELTFEKAREGDKIDEPPMSALLKPDYFFVASYEKMGNTTHPQRRIAGGLKASIDHGTPNAFAELVKANMPSPTAPVETSEPQLCYIYWRVVQGSWRGIGVGTDLLKSFLKSVKDDYPKLVATYLIVEEGRDGLQGLNRLKFKEINCTFPRALAKTAFLWKSVEGGESLTVRLRVQAKPSQAKHGSRSLGDIVVPLQTQPHIEHMGYDDYNDYEGRWNSYRRKGSAGSGYEGDNWGPSYEQRDDYASTLDLSRTQIFVRHLPESMDESAVRNMFGKFGPIESVLFRGDGGALVFIRYQYPDSAQDAVNHMNNFTVPWPSGGPYTLLVEFARPKPLKFGKGSSGGGGKGKGRGGNYDEDWGEIAPPVPSSRYIRERSRSPYSGRWDESGKGKGKGKANGGGGGAPRGLKEATCLVHNIPEGTTWEHLKNFFSRAGFECPYTRVSKTEDDVPVGIASFDSVEKMLEAMRALSNSTMFFANNPSAASTTIHMELDGMKRPTPGAFYQTIKDFVGKEDSPPIAENIKEGEGPSTVYCGGLANDVPVEELTSMFAPFGQILRLDVKPPFHEWKGSYAFVLYDNPDSAIAAVKALNGMEMPGAPNGRIQVDIQQQRKHWPGSAAGR
ncbi:hypothetical protein FOL47_004914 [Perkinsus chesapeaki]|uniref:RRM domain-containing protein n=1 Tax=Perkinsus chesapeaki TaxID=330153 RepID=A0A7J6LZY3_PERCH|nr:hypothetical protein FOL47_004914 [Perkinsus chesapeaki]